MTQAQISEKLELSQSAYSRLERGETPFTMPQLRKASETLRISAPSLIKAADDAAGYLAKRGVTVLDDRPKEEESQTNWLWVAAGVLVAAVAAVLLAQDPGKK